MINCRLYSSFFSILCFSLLSNAQISFSVDGKFGFKSDGQIIIAPSYDYASNFHESLACVHKDGEWGYINVKNEWVSDKFDKIQPICDGFGKVQKNGKLGVVDGTGKLVIPIVYDNIKKTSDGELILTKDTLKGLKSSNIEIPCSYKSVGQYHKSFAFGKHKNGSYDIFDKVGLMLRNQNSFISKWGSIKPDSNLIATKDGKYGLFNVQTRSWSTKPKFDYLDALYCDFTINGKKSEYIFYILFKKINEKDKSSLSYDGTSEENDLQLISLGDKKIKIKGVSGFLPYGDWREEDFEIIFKNGKKELLSALIVKKLGLKPQ